MKWARVIHAARTLGPAALAAAAVLAAPLPPSLFNLRFCRPLLLPEPDGEDAAVADGCDEDGSMPRCMLDHAARERAFMPKPGLRRAKVVFDR